MLTRVREPSGLALNERDLRALLAREGDERFVEYARLRDGRVSRSAECDAVFRRVRSAAALSANRELGCLRLLGQSGDRPQVTCGDRSCRCCARGLSVREGRGLVEEFGPGE